MIRKKVKLGAHRISFVVYSLFFAWISLPAGVYAIGGDADPPELKSLASLIIKVINLGLTFSAPVAAAFIIIGGIKYSTATSDPKALAAAKSTITYSIIGLLTVLLATAIVKIIATLVGVSDTSFIEKVTIPEAI